jgi:signal transduction histidine kinase/ActR/RegA family two-component response regulator
MRSWFDALPIHRKLVLTAVLVSGASLTLAMLIVVALEVSRYRSTSIADTASLAEVVAENSAAAVVFSDPDFATEALTTMRVRADVRRACLFLPDGRLFAGFSRAPEFACAPQARDLPWRVVAASAPVRQSGEVIGTVYVERDLSEIWARVRLGAMVGLGVLALAIGFAFVLAERLNRTVSRPITALAAAARNIGLRPELTTIPAMTVAPDEVGELTSAFTGMLRRVQDATVRLTESNDALRHEAEERRRAEAAREELLVREREASRLKDEFLAAVSHELRTPLNAILGWSQILATRAVDPETSTRAVASIIRNARAQTRVIEDLVDVSRIITGKLNLRLEQLDFREPVEAAVDVIRPAAEAKGVSLTVDLPAGPCLVTGDRDRLQQVAWNLLSNAAKFTSTGGSVTVRITDADGNYALDVSDTGAGISADFLPYMFDRFRQADGTIAKTHAGLGLGLSIVKELTELHGGAVSAQSAGPGHGATVTIQLPRFLAGSEPPGLERYARRAGPVLAGVRVLAVDDNADAREVLQASLSESGAIVQVASSGQEVLRLLEHEQFDVLICDLAMPHMDGFELLTRIRRGGTAQSPSLPAIALTAHASAVDKAKTRAAGFRRHIAKPFEPDSLASAVSAALEPGDLHDPL